MAFLLCCFRPETPLKAPGNRIQPHFEPSPPDPFEELSVQLEPQVGKFRDACSKLKGVVAEAAQEANQFSSMVLVKRPVVDQGWIGNNAVSHYGLHLGKGVVVELVPADPDASFLNNTEARVVTVAALIGIAAVGAYALTVPMVAKYVGQLTGLSGLSAGAGGAATAASVITLSTEDKLKLLNQAVQFIKVQGLLPDSVMLNITTATKILNDGLQSWKQPGGPLSEGSLYSTNSRSFQASKAGNMVKEVDAILKNPDVAKLIKALEAGANAYKLMTSPASANDGIVRLTHIYAFARPPSREARTGNPDKDTVFARRPVTSEYIDKHLPPKEILAMTSRALGKIPFRALTQNSESMARFLATGDATSFQGVGAAAGGGALAGAGVASAVALATGPLGWATWAAAAAAGALVGGGAVALKHLSPELAKIQEDAERYGPLNESRYATDAEREIMTDLIRSL